MTAVLEAPVRRRAFAGLAPRGLRWLMWRQLRLAVWVLFGLVVVAGVAAVWFHGQEVDYIASHGIAGCEAISLDPHCQGPGIQQGVLEFRATYGRTLLGSGLLLALLPAVVGAGIGAPLLGQELERGTWKLVLSQGVGRGRWVLAKLASAGLLVAVVSGVLALMYRWVWQPSGNNVSGIGWYSQAFFASGGPALVAACLLALALGALVGALLRRTLPAMAVTLVLTGLVEYVLYSVRPYLWSGRTVVGQRPELTNTTWVFGHGFVRPDGTRLPYYDCFPGDGAQCAAKYAGTKEFTDLHRAADYWPLQGMESLICLGAAVLLAVVTVGWIRRRLA
ncbi:ABC transporter permease subunit [Kitasatospora sp. NPDC006697]|uniref:ABC transporter permease subunit n=1 Tax=Kitasatospora sp. NPDC006697 TaxID=3364020 RepID=UPI00369BA0A7